jgi:NADH-quinone oxidoreductase subunit L
MAKSAQIPMHVWLPNSMAGPSPVSALIHSATMVCAGVYLLVKISFVLHEDIYFYITLVGFIGAISMGLVSIFVDDLKRAIAFSTLSQISIMFLAIGLKLFAFSMAHLHAHAYFKALWFLIAGSIIKATGKTKISEINNMHKDNKILSYSALIATLNLCSIFPTGGFFSKEMLALEIKNIPIWGDYIFYIFLVSAFITCVYSLRLYFSIFLSTGNTKKINKVTYIEKNVIIIFTLLTLIITPFILDLVNKMNNNDTFYDFISVGKNFFIPIVIVVLAAFLIKVFSLRQKMNFSFLVQEIYFQKAYNLFSHILLKKSNLLANLDNKLDLIIKKSSHYFYSNSIKLSNYLQPYVVTNSLMYIAASIFIIILIGALL